MVWYYDVVKWNREGMGANSHLPHYAISTWEQTAISLKWSSVIIKDGGADKQTRILKLEY